MNEILKMLNELKADDLDSLIVRANILLEKKRKEEAEQALLERERLRQEKIEQAQKRLREINALKQKLAELQSQQPDIPDPVNGDGFVMHEPAPVQPKPAPAPQPVPAPQPARTICPHCGRANEAGSMFCSICGQRMDAPKAAAPKPAAPQPAKAQDPQVRQAAEGMKNWEKRPNEYTIRVKHEIKLLQPYDGTFAHSMEVTDQRILLTRESAASKNAGMVARMGVGGLVGGLIADGLQAHSSKPWLEIPLTAISSCGVQNGSEFFIVADQTYVLKNKKYEKLLPDLVAQAKSRGV